MEKGPNRRSVSSSGPVVYSTIDTATTHDRQPGKLRNDQVHPSGAQ